MVNAPNFETAAAAESRVPQLHSDIEPTSDKQQQQQQQTPPAVDKKLTQDLYVRTSWVDAKLAYNEFSKGKSNGSKYSLRNRMRLQNQMEGLGFWIQNNPRKLIIGAIALLTMLICVGVKQVHMQTKVSELWVADSNRLNAELEYTDDTLGSENDNSNELNQMIIQTANGPENSVLNTDALLLHMEVLRKAMTVSIYMYDTDWGLRNLCVMPDAPYSERDPYWIVDAMQAVVPCTVITPLDCFWEGSKLIVSNSPMYPGPNGEPVPAPSLMQFSWQSMNPSEQIKLFKTLQYSYDFQTIDTYMKQAGITTGYTRKPCLQPEDPACPPTAPNKYSGGGGAALDIGAILTGGCAGYAANMMKWPEELIVGGIERNRSGFVRKAKALQTVIQYMTHAEFYERYRNDHKSAHIDWTEDKALAIMNAWRLKFNETVAQALREAELGKEYNIYIFMTDTLDEILAKFTQPNSTLMIIGAVCIAFYVVFMLVRWRDPVMSQSFVGLIGVLLLAYSTAGGLAFSSLIGVNFVPASVQVVPVLCFSLAIEHIFKLTAEYAKSNAQEQTKDILKRIGPSIFYNAAMTAGCFYAASFIPVPATRVFCVQASIITCFNACAVLLIFPALITFDLKRRAGKFANYICCCCCCVKPKTQPSSPMAAVNDEVLKSPTTSFVHNDVDVDLDVDVDVDVDIDPEQQQQSTDGNELLNHDFRKYSLNKFAAQLYTPFLMRRPTTAFILVGFAVLNMWSLVKLPQLRDGLEVIDLVPRNTQEYHYLEAHTKLFGFYHMYAVTQGDFNYPQNQALLHEYHESFVRVPQIIKNDNGGLPHFWLSAFRDWLLNMQEIFDKGMASKELFFDGWSTNATAESMLAYTLMVQSGNSDNPIDRNLAKHNRMVNSAGIIYPKAFYNYLSAWVGNDGFTYSALQAKLYPEPQRYVFVPKEEGNLLVPKSARIRYAQTRFYLHGLSDTNAMKSLISRVRGISDKFNALDLPNYPSGAPFMFWEQYMSLHLRLFIIAVPTLATAFGLSFCLLLSVKAAILVMFCVISCELQILAAMAVCGLSLSAIPAIVLVLSFGMMHTFMASIALGFVTSIGNSNRRLLLSMRATFRPLLCGMFAMAIAVCMLSTSPFEFVLLHFFRLLLIVLCIGAANSFVVFPVLLALVSPRAEVLPIAYDNRIATPSPTLPRKQQQYQSATRTTIMTNRGERAKLSNTKSSSKRQKSKTPKLTKHDIINNRALTPITEESASNCSDSLTCMCGTYCDGNCDNQMPTTTEPTSTPTSTPMQQQPYCQYRPYMPMPQQQQQQYSNYAPWPMFTTVPQQQYQPNVQHTPQPQSPYGPPPQYHEVNGASVNSSTSSMGSNDQVQTITVKPEVTVETSKSDPNFSKVTATANIKVELLTPRYNNSNMNNSYTS